MSNALAALQGNIMPKQSFSVARRPLLAAVLFFCVSLRAADYVELNATIESVRWQHGGIWKSEPVKVHCVVGANDWQMDGTFASGLNTKTWFTGTNLIMSRSSRNRTPGTRQISKAAMGQIPQGRPPRAPEVGG